MNGGVVVGTIGERIDELTLEYCGIYERLRDDSVFSEKAKNIALTDPTVQKHIWTEVEKNVKAHIEEFPLPH